MSSRMNGYRPDQYERPSSEQMVDLHVYVVPPDLWRKEFNNALNTNIDRTISLGFIRAYRDTRVCDLRDEIERQVGIELVPRSYVFLKSVGRSLTRLKSKQEYQLKVKNFLPPQAYAPELYLLEATPEVQAAIAASSSEGSTRPQTRTSFQDIETYRPSESYRQSQGESLQTAKYSTVPNGGGNLATNPYSPLPQIESRLPRDQSPPRQQSPSRQHPRYPTGQYSPKQFDPYNQQSSQRGPPRTPPAFTKNTANPKEKLNGHRRENGENYGPQLATVSWDDSPTNQQNPPNPSVMPLADSHPTPLDAPPAPSPRRNALDRRAEDYLPPLSATPPQSASARETKAQPGHRTNGDSGIAGFTPDETYRENQNDVLDRRKADQDAVSRLQPPSPVQDEGEERLRQLQQDEDGKDWERRRQEEQDRLKREEQERRQEDEDDKRKADENRDKMAAEVKMFKTASDEDLNKFPSPPPLRLASPERDTASARERRKKEKEKLLKELEQVREERHAAERSREELVRRAKQMQSKTQNRRNYARDLWKKRYFEEKKKTGPFEEQCNKLRLELDMIHKRLLSTLEGPKEKATKLQEIKPSSKVGSPRPSNNFKIQATRLQHEIEDIRRRVDHAKMKLTGEMKLRNQAETELRALRAELMQKKINLTLSRNSHLTSFAPPATDMNFMTARTAAVTPRS